MLLSGAPLRCPSHVLLSCAALLQRTKGLAQQWTRGLGKERRCRSSGEKPEPFAPEGGSVKPESFAPEGGSVKGSAKGPGLSRSSEEGEDADPQEILKGEASTNSSWRHADAEPQEILKREARDPQEIPKRSSRDSSRDPQERSKHQLHLEASNPVCAPLPLHTSAPLPS